MGGHGYNGWSVTEHADVSGLRRLGIATVPQIVTAGCWSTWRDAGPAM
jgi:hypothetical protein